MVDSVFEHFRSKLRQDCEKDPGLRARMAWLEFRTIFHRLIQEPVWNASPETVEQCLNRPVEYKVLDDLKFYLRADEAGESRPAEFATARDCFAALERYHDQARSAVECSHFKRRIWKLEPPNTTAPTLVYRRREFEDLQAELSNAPAAISISLLHGSLADALTADGFSDADVLCVIRRPNGDGRTFVDAAEWLLRLNHALYRFNPYMHHGPMIAFESELDGTAEALLPSAILNGALFLKGRIEQIAYLDQGPEEILALAPFEDYFEKVHLYPADIRNGFDALWWTSNILILPSLIHQVRTIRSIYKREVLSSQSPTGEPSFDLFIGQVESVRLRLATWLRTRPFVAADISLNENPGSILERHRRADTLDSMDLLDIGLDAKLMHQGRYFWRFVLNQAVATDTRGRIGSKPQEQNHVLPPRPLSLQRYDEVRQEFIRRASQIPAVVAVYEFGQVGCPGLSDLDFCVVLQDSARGKPEQLRIASFSEDDAYVMDHDPLFVGESAAKHLSAVFPIFDCRKLWGKTVNFPLTLERSSEIVQAVISHKNWTKYPADFDGLLRSRPLKIRTVLAFLHSSHHIAACLAHLGGKIVPEIEYAQEIDRQSRERFLAEKAVDGRVVEEAIQLVYKLSKEVRSSLRTHWIGRGMHPDDNLGQALSGYTANPRLREVLSEYWTERTNFITHELAAGRPPNHYVLTSTEYGKFFPHFVSFGWRWIDGWYPAEGDGDSTWRWSGDEGSIEICSSSEMDITLSGEVISLSVPNRLWVRCHDGPLQAIEIAHTGFYRVSFSIKVQSGLQRMVFRGENPGVSPPNDSRCLAFAWRDLVLLPQLPR